MRSVVHKIYPNVADGKYVELFKSHDDRFVDGGQLRDFVYVKDCVNVVMWLLENPRVSGLLNIGTGKARSFRDLALAVGRGCGREVGIRYVDVPPTIRARYQYFTEANVTKLRRLGYARVFTELEEGVRDYIVNHLQPNRDAEPPCELGRE